MNFLPFSLRKDGSRNYNISDKDALAAANEWKLFYDSMGVTPPGPVPLFQTSQGSSNPQLRLSSSRKSPSLVNLVTDSEEESASQVTAVWGRYIYYI